MGIKEGDKITLVGSTLSPERFTEILEGETTKGNPLCFGRHFAKTAKECSRCLAPVIVEERLYLLREICEARTKGASTYAQLVVLTVQDVISRLEQGKSVEEIFSEVLGKADPELQAEAARKLLALRFRYMKRDLGLPVPDLPRRKELVQHVRGKEVD